MMSPYKELEDDSEATEQHYKTPPLDVGHELVVSHDGHENADDDDDDEDDAASGSDYASSYASDYDDSDVSVPDDEFRLVYLIMVLLGAGLLFPYNVLITAVDYFKVMYPEDNIETLIAMIMNYPAPFVQIFLIKFGRKLSFSLRIVFWFSLCSVLMVCLPFLHEKFEHTTAKYITYVFIFLFGISTAVLQSSIFGFAGLLPPRYTQAIMGGNSWAGLIVCACKIFTKLSTHDLTESAYIYFSLSGFITMLCVAGYVYMLRLPFTHHHILKSGSPALFSLPGTPAPVSPAYRSSKQRPALKRLTSAPAAYGGHSAPTRLDYETMDSPLPPMMNSAADAGSYRSVASPYHKLRVGARTGGDDTSSNGTGHPRSAMAAHDSKPHSFISATHAPRLANPTFRASSSEEEEEDEDFDDDSFDAAGSRHAHTMHDDDDDESGDDHDDDVLAHVTMLPPPVIPYGAVNGGSEVVAPAKADENQKQQKKKKKKKKKRRKTTKAQQVHMQYGDSAQLGSATPKQISFRRFLGNTIGMPNALAEDSDMSDDADVEYVAGTAHHSHEHQQQQKPVDYKEMFGRIWHLALIVFSVFFFTFMVYPGIVTTIESTMGLGDWYPIILISEFNVFDLLGRVLAGYKSIFSHRVLKWPAMARFVCVPLFVCCVSPLIFDSDAYVYIIMAVFALSNGYVASLGMMFAPGLVDEHEKEASGYMMSFFLTFGILAGSHVALLIQHIFGI